MDSGTPPPASGAPFGLAPDEWARLRELLDRGLDLPAEQRFAWLASLGAEHAALKPHLHALLAQSMATSSPLDALPAVEPDPGAGAAEAAGAMVGPYRLLRALGEGGMASVWLAERTDLLQQRQVALKLPHGAWRRAGLAQRLAREREILATLEHPHIARLYDAGVTDAGQPYLALEYVQGEPIDRWCDARQAGLAQRLALFVQVCDAVAHAHTRLVVHRDLKPANILVDPAGQVKLLDFGIAKVLEGDTAEATELTHETGRALTPDYAAPEQILGQPLGTAADVYSLGVLLFELLAGARPYRLARGSRAALEEAIVQAAPARPSEATADPARRRALRGDLDLIVLKALKKAPEERYATVGALADDLRRHLAHQPVLAQPDSRVYQLRKFVQRHRTAVAMALALATTLAAGAGVALWQAAEARASRDEALAAKARADDEARAARGAERVAEAQADLADFLLDEMSAGQPVEATRALLERALAMGRAQHRDDPAVRGEMLVDVAMRLRAIGGDARVEELLAEAEPLLRSAGRPEGLARLLCVRATHLQVGGRAAEVEPLFDEARRALARSSAADALAHIGCLLEEAIVARLRGNLAQAVAGVEQADVRERRSGRGPRGFGAEISTNLALAYLAVGRHADAAAASRRSIAMLLELGDRSGPRIGQARRALAIALREGGRPLDALAEHQAGGDDPGGETGTLNQRLQYAQTLMALARLDEALRLLDRLEPAAHAQGRAAELRDVRLRKVDALVAAGRLAAADALQTEIEAAASALLAEQRYAARGVLFARLHWALAAGALDRAEDLLARTRALVENKGRDDGRARRDLQRAAARLALARGDARGAADATASALALSTEQAIDAGASLAIALDLLLRSQVERASGDVDAARADAAAAARHAAAAAGETHPATRQARGLVR